MRQAILLSFILFLSNNLLAQVDTIDFAQYTIDTYDVNQDAGSYSILNGELTLEGNSWKKISIPYTLTEVSVLTFEYRVGEEGRIGGIGMDTNNKSDQNHIFQLSGRATYGFQDYKTYTGTDWVSYTIPIGSYITGDVGYLVFVGDDNRDLQNNSFRNITISEAQVPPVAVESLHIQKSSNEDRKSVV